MDTPLVSVIIIFWNASAFIREAIESVLSQTYSAWRLYLVDDGSTDESTAIAQWYAQQDPVRICYLDHPAHENRGMSASRNLGIQHARGEFVAFLDADDFWVSNILEEQVSILQSHPEAAMVYGPIRYWYSWTGNPHDSERDFVRGLGVPPNTLLSPPELVTLFLQNKATVPSGFLVRLEMINQVGGFEDSFRSFYEDQVFCSKLCLAAPVYAAGECWYWYRKHPRASCSIGKTTGEYYSARRIFLEWLADYLVVKDISDPQVWQALNWELLPYRHPTRHRMVHFVRRYKLLVQQLVGSAIRSIYPPLPDADSTLDLSQHPRADESND